MKSITLIAVMIMVLAACQDANEENRDIQEPYREESRSPYQDSATDSANFRQQDTMNYERRQGTSPQ